MSVLIDEVEFTIRCAHQSFPDQVVRCSKNWSVGELKSYLHSTNPQCPDPTKQKLIYAGQLLKNVDLIKDVIRVYGPEHKQVLHLVYMPVVNSFAKESSELRKRTVVNSDVASQSSVQRDSVSVATGPAAIQGNMFRPSETVSPQVGLPFFAHGSSLPTYAPSGFGWGSHQIYHMYMANYLAYLQQLYGPFGLHAMAGMNPTVYSGVINPGGIPGVVRQQETSPNLVDVRGNQNVNIGNVPAAPAAAGAAPVAQAMNAQGGIDEDEPPERDWLDWCYFASRMTFLFVILYFYSSVERFLLVIMFFIFFYGHQAGWFGRRNAANNAAQPQAQAAPNEDAGAAGPEGRQHAPEAANGINGSANENTEGENRLPNSARDGQAQVAENSQPAPIPVQTAWQIFSSTCYTFVTSFFISLIPQRPAALNA